MNERITMDKYLEKKLENKSICISTVMENIKDRKKIEFEFLYDFDESMASLISSLNINKDFLKCSFIHFSNGIFSVHKLKLLFDSDCIKNDDNYLFDNKSNYNSSILLSVLSMLFTSISNKKLSSKEFSSIYETSFNIFKNFNLKFLILSNLKMVENYSFIDIKENCFINTQLCNYIDYVKFLSFFLIFDKSCLSKIDKTELFLKLVEEDGSSGKILNKKKIFEFVKSLCNYSILLPDVMYNCNLKTNSFIKILNSFEKNEYVNDEIIKIIDELKLDNKNDNKDREVTNNKINTEETLSQRIKYITESNSHIKNKNNFDDEEITNLEIQKHNFFLRIKNIKSKKMLEKLKLLIKDAGLHILSNDQDEFIDIFYCFLKDKDRLMNDEKSITIYKCITYYMILSKEKYKKFIEFILSYHFLQYSSICENVEIDMKSIDNLFNPQFYRKMLLDFVLLQNDSKYFFINLKILITYYDLFYNKKLSYVDQIVFSLAKSFNNSGYSDYVCSDDFSKLLIDCSKKNLYDFLKLSKEYEISLTYNKITLMNEMKKDKNKNTDRERIVMINLLKSKLSSFNKLIESLEINKKLNKDILIDDNIYKLEKINKIGNLKLTSISNNGNSNKFIEENKEFKFGENMFKADKDIDVSKDINLIKKSDINDNECIEELNDSKDERYNAKQEYTQLNLKELKLFKTLAQPKKKKQHRRLNSSNSEEFNKVKDKFRSNNLIKLISLEINEINYTENQKNLKILTEENPNNLNTSNNKIEKIDKNEQISEDNILNEYEQNYQKKHYHNTDIIDISDVSNEHITLSENNYYTKSIIKLSNDNLIGNNEYKSTNCIIPNEYNDIIDYSNKDFINNSVKFVEKDNIKLILNKKVEQLFPQDKIDSNHNSNFQDKKSNDENLEKMTSRKSVLTSDTILAILELKNDKFDRKSSAFSKQVNQQEKINEDKINSKMSNSTFIDLFKDKDIVSELNKTIESISNSKDELNMRIYNFCKNFNYLELHDLMKCMKKLPDLEIDLPRVKINFFEKNLRINEIEHNFDFDSLIKELYDRKITTSVELLYLICIDEFANYYNKKKRERNPITLIFNNKIEDNKILSDKGRCLLYIFISNENNNSKHHKISYAFVNTRKKIIISSDDSIMKNFNNFNFKNFLCKSNNNKLVNMDNAFANLITLFQLEMLIKENSIDEEIIKEFQHESYSNKILISLIEYLSCFI